MHNEQELQKQLSHFKAHESQRRLYVRIIGAISILIVLVVDGSADYHHHPLLNFRLYLGLAALLSEALIWLGDYQINDFSHISHSLLLMWCMLLACVRIAAMTFFAFFCAVRQTPLSIFLIAPVIVMCLLGVVLDGWRIVDVSMIKHIKIGLNKPRRQ